MRFTRISLHLFGKCNKKTGQISLWSVFLICFLTFTLPSEPQLPEQELPLPPPWGPLSCGCGA